MPGGIEWSDIKGSKSCDELRELIRRVEERLRAKGDGFDGDANYRKYRTAIEEVESKLLPQAQEIALISIWQDTTRPQVERDAAETALRQNLELMKRRLELWNQSWESQELLKMHNWLQTFISEKCTGTGEPFFKTPTYPAVKDDPIRFIRIFLGGGRG